MKVLKICETLKFQINPPECNATLTYREAVIDASVHFWKLNRNERQEDFRIRSSGFVNCVELCLATFDTSGKCLKAQGYLRRALQEVS